GTKCRKNFLYGFIVTEDYAVLTIPNSWIKKAHPALECIVVVPEIDKVGAESHVIVGNADRNLVGGHFLLARLQVLFQLGVEAARKSLRYLECTFVCEQLLYIGAAFKDRLAASAGREMQFESVTQFGRKSAVQVAGDGTPNFAAVYIARRIEIVSHA